MEKKNQHEIYARKLREKERDLRNLKKTELQLKVANEGLAHTQVFTYSILMWISLLFRISSCQLFLMLKNISGIISRIIEVF